MELKNINISIGGDNCYNRRTGYTCPYYDNGSNVIGRDDEFMGSCLLFRVCLGGSKHHNVIPHERCLEAQTEDTYDIDAHNRSTFY